MSQISRWLKELGIAQYAQAFESSDVDLRSLPELTDDDLKDLGVSLGHRRLIQRAIREASPAPPRVVGDTPADDGSTGREHVAERRQVTVMFCDLVGSTTLAEQMDPEEFREVIASYQSAASVAIREFDGYIARYMGDGLLVYFGYPQAHEDDAERAIRAGLKVVRNVGALELPGIHQVQVRVGISTGLVIAGDIVGEGASEERAVLGETPNLASRLQGLAQPDTVVVSESTKRLVGQRFVFEDLGPHAVKGLSSEVEVFRAESVHDDYSRFSAEHQEAITELVGREGELTLLEQCWNRALDHEGQLVLLEGEPGIGKSRLIRALTQRAMQTASEVLTFQCSPYHLGSAFYPIIGTIQKLADISASDDPTEQYDKLQRWLGTQFPAHGSAVPLVSELLSLDSPSRPDLSPQRQRRETIQVLADLVVARARAGPILIAFEDVHWADPSTLEALGAIIDRIQTLEVLLVLTFRPEFEPIWSEFGHLTRLSMNRLGNADVGRIVYNTAGEKPLSDEVVKEIAARADGVPLFVEELTKSVIEAGMQGGEQPSQCSEDSQVAIILPSTLQDALLARLDRLGSAKAVAQSAACIGREFDYKLLSATYEASIEQLDRALVQLVDSRLVLQRGEPPESVYTFSHALVRDAAQASLLNADRRRIHAKIAAVLNEHFSTQMEAQPELLALHLEEASLSREAAEQWYLAGIAAAKRSAHVEAVSHLGHCIRLVASVPSQRDTELLEMKAQNALALSLGLTRGHAEEVQRAYTRAREIAEELNESRTLYQSVWGLWHINTLRMELDTAKELSFELLRVAKATEDEELILQAHHSAWTVLLYVGDLESCMNHALQGQAIYEPSRHSHHALTYGGHDPGACSYYQAALSRWLLGYPDQAVAEINTAIELARTIKQPSSEIIALSNSTYIHQFRGDVEETRRAVSETIALAQELQNARYEVTGQLLFGWTETVSGRWESGISLMEQSLSRLQEIGGNLRRTYYLALYAEACMQGDKLDNADYALNEAQALLTQHGERWWEAELLRLKAELLLRQRPSDVEQAVSWLTSARNVASAQGSRSLALRSIAALATQLSRLGENADARNMLGSMLAEWSARGRQRPVSVHSQFALHTGHSSLGDGKKNIGPGLSRWRNF
jgi:predicted ATPase/class 3 adenylate cyclase